MATGKVLVYLLRRDLRVSDNPILHFLSTSADHGFTHLLPVYVFPAHQMELSGLIKPGLKSPYPPARSSVAHHWRCGPHRARFVAQSVWDLRTSLQHLGSGLVIRAGDAATVVAGLSKSLESSDAFRLGAVWMTEELSAEEVDEQRAIAAVCSLHSIDFKLWQDEKYLIDDRDTGLSDPKQLPDVFTTYRKSQEPLRQRPRSVLPAPVKSSLPPMPQESIVAPPHDDPFEEATSLDHLEACLVQPLDKILRNPPDFPQGAESGHPLRGGESHAAERLQHLVSSGVVSSYKETRNGLLGVEYSTKLSAYLAQGCITARQVHEKLMKFEDGTDDSLEHVEGFGKGESDGTSGVRFELLWRDYMRLCTAKFQHNLFRLAGFKQDQGYEKKWKTADRQAARHDQHPPPKEVARILERFYEGTTGMGLIDASQRELFLTGYTSNRARQNAASFLTKHLGIDWRYGAEWYEMMLTDYDVSSNWANWQYMAGVGNDPRGESRIFNPVKQGFDYDKQGAYVRAWIPELRVLEKPENVFQAWTASKQDLEQAGLASNIMVTDPVKRINFAVDRKPRGGRRQHSRRGKGQGRGGGGSVSGNGSAWRGHGTGGNGQNCSPPGHGQEQTSVQDAYTTHHAQRQGQGQGEPMMHLGSYTAAPFYDYGSGGWYGEYGPSRGRGYYNYARGVGGRWYGQASPFRGGGGGGYYGPPMGPYGQLPMYPRPANMGPGT
ncbi:hypothetical protein CDD81_7446 [Ophiocordyceps australis]|uniref:Cryptochrome DASH n=1 Tax=Ophiocordyceps australis TaxID=1399860 RepID=A0A2C5YHL1_9HYPO|nr:hypothetical protein CDD81_7446 [Ophiocordyceps australis]